MCEGESERARERQGNLGRERRREKEWQRGHWGKRGQNGAFCACSFGSLPHRLAPTESQIHHHHHLLLHLLCGPLVAPPYVMPCLSTNPPSAVALRVLVHCVSLE